MQGMTKEETTVTPKVQALLSPVGSSSVGSSSAGAYTQEEEQR